MTQPVYKRFPVDFVPPPEMSIRSRREYTTRDSTNARQFEHWQTDGKAMTNNRPDPNAAAPFHDFLPINSRFEERSYRGQPRFDRDGDRLGMNSYFDKYDPNYDSRNAVRELQAVVYEDKNSVGVKESSRLVSRNFDNRWISDAEQREMMAASMALRPMMDDYSKVYRPL